MLRTKQMAGNYFIDMCAQTEETKCTYWGLRRLYSEHDTATGFSQDSESVNNEIK